MTGFWLASYVMLWLLVVILSFLTGGLLQQLGLLNRRLEQVGSPSMEASNAILPAPENDGPAFGSSLPHIEADTINEFGSLMLLAHCNKDYTLLMFMSPLCESCQYLVDPLNQLAKERSNHIQVIVIMRANEGACRAFLSIFPLHIPVVCDDQRTITMNLGVHHAPFGAVYDEHGILRRKGLIQKENDLLTLLEDVKEP